MSVSHVSVEQLSRLAHKAQKVRIRQEYYGGYSLELRFWPFGLLKRRFKLDGSELEVFHSRMRGTARLLSV